MADMLPPEFRQSVVFVLDSVCYVLQVAEHRMPPVPRVLTSSNPIARLSMASLFRAVIEVGFRPVTEDTPRPIISSGRRNHSYWQVLEEPAQSEHLRSH